MSMSITAESLGCRIGYAFVEAGLCSTPEAAFESLPEDSEDRKNLIQNIAQFMFPEYPDDVQFNQIMADMEGYRNNPEHDLRDKARLLIQINGLMKALVEVKGRIGARVRNRQEGNPRVRRIPRANSTRRRRLDGKPPGRIPGATPISEAELEALQKEIDSLIITTDATVNTVDTIRKAK